MTADTPEQKAKNRCEIVISKHPNDYPAAMGELRIRLTSLKKRTNSIIWAERLCVYAEIEEINRILKEYSKPSII